MVTIVTQGPGCALELIRNVVSMSMIVGEIATMMQVLKKGPVGSDYFYSEGTVPSFLSVFMLAGAV